MIDHNEVIANVTAALAEDIGSGDITTQLLPAAMATANITAREYAVVAGQAWANTVFHELDKMITIKWYVEDGQTIMPNQPLCELKGSAKSLLTGERCAINFLQTLSATATTVANFVNLLKDKKTQLLDTRKTIPGLRYAQKYAVRCGGGSNHRYGLYDAFLIKENHIITIGSIEKAIALAKQQAKLVIVEVESLAELAAAVKAGADQILLDNFSDRQLKAAVAIAKGKAKLEASGNINQNNILTIADTGVDYISIGALTKDIQAIDFSMRISV